MSAGTIVERVRDCDDDDGGGDDGDGVQCKRGKKSK